VARIDCDATPCKQCLAGRPRQNFPSRVQSPAAYGCSIWRWDSADFPVRSALYADKLRHVRADVFERPTHCHISSERRLILKLHSSIAGGRRNEAEVL
jgi:hypothetical protein